MYKLILIMGLMALMTITALANERCECNQEYHYRYEKHERDGKTKTKKTIKEIRVLDDIMKSKIQIEETEE